MASTVPSLRYVRCPKCLKVLPEPPGIPVYKCGGCGTTLEAREHSNSRETSSLASVASSSNNISNTTSLGKHGPTTSDRPAVLEQERNSKGAFSEHGMNCSAVSESNGEGGREKAESSVPEQIGIKETPLQQDKDGPVSENHLQEGFPTKAENISYQEVRKSFVQRVSEANDSLKSTDKLEESPESLERDINLEGDKFNGKFRNATSFRLRSTSYHAYDGSVSSTDEERKDRVPQKYLLLSRRTFQSRKVANSDDSIEEAREYVMKNSVNVGAQAGTKKHSRMFSVESKTSATISEVSSRSGVQAREWGTFTSEDFHSAQNWMESEIDLSVKSQSKDTTKFVKFRYTENGDQENILRKVDELRDELIGFFHRTADGNGRSPFGTRSRQFEGKVPPKQYRSSLIPDFPKQPNSYCLHCHPHESICCHHSHCSHCPHNVCCHPPEGATSRRLHMESASRPLHMESSPPLHREPQVRQSNDKRPQTIKRLCRPVSGGAPYVICYRCYKLLQLPADFLVSAKRVHKLRCGGCSEVLKYSFRPRIHPVPPQTPAVEAPHPPSEDENVVLDGITAPRGKGIAGGDPVSYSEEYEGIIAPRGKGMAGGDPVSYSEEYDLSFGKSYSYDAEPSRHLQRSHGGVVEEEVNGREENRSRLHKLMGYSSARHLLFDTISAGEGRRIGHARYI